VGAPEGCRGSTTAQQPNAAEQALQQAFSGQLGGTVFDGPLATVVVSCATEAPAAKGAPAAKAAPKAKGKAAVK